LLGSPLIPLTVLIVTWSKKTNGLKSYIGLPGSALALPTTGTDEGAILQKAASGAERIRIEMQKAIVVVDNVIFY
jgi:hypothetical protein